MGKSSALLSLLALFTPLAAGEDYTAFEVKSTTCQNGNTVDISLDCEENNGVCRLGDSAQVSGTVTFADYPPQNVHIESKACLFYMGGTALGCYDVASIDEDLCNYLVGTADGGCPSSGSEYAASVDLVLPSEPRNVGYWYTFNLVNYIYDSSDDSLFDVCTVSVQTTRTSSDASTAYGMAGVGALATLLVAAYVSKKRRSGTIDLAKEENIATKQADFVEMTDGGVSV